MSRSHRPLSEEVSGQAPPAVLRGRAKRARSLGTVDADHVGRDPSSNNKPRKKGSRAGIKNRRTIAKERGLTYEQMRKDGELPHEFMLRVVRGEAIEHWHVGRHPRSGEPLKPKRMLYYPSMEERIDCAKAAANYFAPKLATIEVVRGLNDAGLDALLAALANQAGIALVTGGEEETDGRGARTDGAKGVTGKTIDGSATLIDGPFASVPART